MKCQLPVSLTVSVTDVRWIEGHAIRRSTRVTMSSVALENKEVVIKQLAFSTMIVCILSPYLKRKLKPNNAASLSILSMLIPLIHYTVHYFVHFTVQPLIYQKV